MKNLKKVLALVLAMAMAFSLTAFAGASYSDFTDAGEIHHKEAVAELVELNVISGKEDGSYFDPAGTVTRAEMAKMICVVLNGGKDPVLTTKPTPSYTDIKGTWAEAYIEYCSSEGIISGRGDGTFAPTATVTASEGAKMLLVALGFDSQVFNLTGANWAINTNVLANQNGFYDELSNIGADVALNRENAAQMIYNCLQAKIMEKSYDKVASDGSITYKYAQSDTKTLLNDKFDAKIYKGILLATNTDYIQAYGYTGTTAGKDKAVIRVTTIDDEELSGSDIKNTTFKAAVDSKLIGQAVTIIQKNDSAKTVYGTAYANEDNNILDITGSYDAANKSDVDDLKDALSDADITGYASTVYGKNMADGQNDTALTVTNDTTLARLTGNGLEVVAIDNDDDNKIDVVLQYKKQVGKVSSYSTKNDGYIVVTNVAGGNLFTSSDPNGNTDTDVVKGFADVAKDDYVLVSVNGKGQKVVEKCESKEVTITGTSGKNLIADGTTYKNSDLSSVKADDNSTTIAAAVANSLNETATLYLDKAGYVVYVDDINSTKDYLYVTAIDSGNTYGDDFSEVKFKAVLNDGTKVTANAYKVNDVKVTKTTGTSTSESGVVTGANCVKVGAYSYSKNSDGTYNLKDAANIDSSATSFQKGQATVGGYAVNSKTVFVASTDDGDTYQVYTGNSNAPSVKNAQFVVAVKKNASDAAATIVFYRAATSSDTDKNTIYVLDAAPSISKSGDDYVYTFKTLVNGEYKELVATEKSSSISSISAGLYIDIGLNSDGKIDVANLTGAKTMGTVQKVKDGVITVGTGSATVYQSKGVTTGLTTVSYDDKTKVIVIEGKNQKDVKEGSVDEIVAIDDTNVAADVSQLYIVTGSDKTDKAAYYTAATIYIIK